jgi:hypothetical protein
LACAASIHPDSIAAGVQPQLHPCSARVTSQAGGPCGPDLPRKNACLRVRTDRRRIRPNQALIDDHVVIKEDQPFALRAVNRGIQCVGLAAPRLGKDPCTCARGEIPHQRNRGVTAGIVHQHDLQSVCRARQRGKRSQAFRQGIRTIVRRHYQRPSNGCCHCRTLLIGVVTTIITAISAVTGCVNSEA